MNPCVVPAASRVTKIRRRVSFTSPSSPIMKSSSFLPLSPSHAALIEWRRWNVAASRGASRPSSTTESPAFRARAILLRSCILGVPRRLNRDTVRVKLVPSWLTVKPRPAKSATWLSRTWTNRGRRRRASAKAMKRSSSAAQAAGGACTPPSAIKWRPCSRYAMNPSPAPSANRALRGDRVRNPEGWSSTPPSGAADTASWMTLTMRSCQAVQELHQPDAALKAGPPGELAPQQRGIGPEPRQILRRRALADDVGQPGARRERQRYAMTAPADRVQHGGPVAEPMNGRQRVDDVADHAGPAPLDPEVEAGAERAMELARQIAEGCRARRRGFGPTAPVVARAAASEHDAIVRGEPEIIEDSTGVDDALASLPAEGVAGAAVERLRRDDLQVNRQEAPTKQPDLRRISRRRDHDAVGRHGGAPLELEPDPRAVREAPHPGVLEDLSAPRHDPLGQSVEQPQRVQRARERKPDGRRGLRRRRRQVDALLELVAVEDLARKTQRLERTDRRSQSRDSTARPRDDELAGHLELAGDSLARHQRCHRLDGAETRKIERAGAVGSVATDQRREALPDAGSQHARRTSRGAGTEALGLEQHHARARPTAEQVIGG